MALAVGYDARGIKDALEAFDFKRIADYGFPVGLIGAARNLVFHESVVEGDELTAFIRGLLEESHISGVHADMTFRLHRHYRCRDPRVLGWRRHPRAARGRPALYRRGVGCDPPAAPRQL